MNAFLLLFLFSVPVQADLNKDEMHPIIREYPHPLMCDFILPNGKKESIILVWAQLKRIDKGALVFDKDGHEVRIPSASYVCYDLLGD